MLLSSIGSRPNLAADAATALVRSIRQGDLQPGARLPSETELARQLGISRPVIREAIAYLKADGVVESRRGLGLFVNQQDALRLRRDEIAASEESILTFLELRLGLEVEAAQLASLRHTPEDLERIEAAAIAMNQADDEGRDSASHDLAFHIAIATASRNRMFLSVLEFVSGPLLGSIKSMRDKDRGDHSNVVIRRADHAAVLDRIRAKDPDGAGEAMRKHISESYRRYAERIFHAGQAPPHPALRSRNV
ncbi:MAG TPA: FadR/GntR family transcriptional regulator [Bosea sp. (in: a-proteobacteria)]|jgi:GntR family transcriptional repressor for pyruvate dehydrogenase complex|uniref:FadR/GntR family transcriptional regulator n=1 Tax=Bosea sp. (in: a-proteobacteria) TaxID=1871050 RepID=UPI002E144C19|nr:FadR/GntR family transcriptional regulator [Bosea sp. (in: a-proteobacteria)]